MANDIHDELADEIDYMVGVGTRHAILRDEAPQVLFELAMAELDAIPNMVRTSYAIGLVNTMAQEWRKQNGALPELFVTMLREIADGGE
jgi:hypothetical protein